jgi:hypothetical protein
LTQVTDLSEIDADEVSIVKRAATGLVWNFLKADSSGDIEVSQPVADALASPAADEAAMVEKLQKAGVSESAVEATVLVCRLTKAFALNIATHIETSKSASGPRGQEHTGEEKAAIAEGEQAALGLTGSDEDDVAYSADERKAMASTGEARSDGSYPIRTRTDVEHAVEDFNRPGSTQADREHIIARARVLDALDALPATWHVAKHDDDSLHARILKTLEVIG